MEAGCACAKHRNRRQLCDGRQWIRSHPRTLGESFQGARILRDRAPEHA
jgi:hypothetical protein